MFSILNNKRGQGVIESLLSLPLVVLSLSAVLFLCYRAVVFYCTDYFVHEALICVDEGSIETCQDRLESQVKNILLNQRPQQIKLTKSHNKITGHVEIHFPLIAGKYGPPIVIQKALTLPIRTEKSWRIL